MTAKMTANFVDRCGRRRTSADCRGSISIEGGLQRLLVDSRTTIFKTVCGLGKPERLARPPNVLVSATALLSIRDDHGYPVSSTVANGPPL